MLSLLGIWLAVLSVRWTSNNKLISSKRQSSKYGILLRERKFCMVHLCKEMFDSLLMSCPRLLNRRFMVSATKLRRQFSFSAEYNRHSFTWLYLDTKSARLIHVLDIRQTPFCVTTMLHTPEPFPSSSKLGRRIQNKNRS